MTADLTEAFANHLDEYDLGDGDETTNGAHTPTSWAPVDLTDALNGVDITAPEILARTDDVSLLYRGRVHWFQGEPEALKGWVVALGAEQVLEVGGSVLWIDFEDDERGITARMRALGVSADVLLSERFTYVRPDEPLEGQYGAVTPASIDLTALLATRWDLAVIDGVTEAMTTEGMSLTDNTDVARWMRLLPKRIAARTGAAVAVIDHVVKSREGQGRYAIGGQHKLAGVTGCTYKVTNTRRFARAIGGDPITGASTITVEKDRPGWVRGRAENGTICVLEITSYPDGGVTARLIPPDEATMTPPWSTCDAVLGYLCTYDGAAKSAIEAEIGGNATTLRGALVWMAGQKWLEVRKEGNAHRHYILDAGRDALNNRGAA